MAVLKRYMVTRKFSFFNSIGKWQKEERRTEVDAESPKEAIKLTASRFKSNYKKIKNLKVKAVKIGN